MPFFLVFLALPAMLPVLPPPSLNSLSLLRRSEEPEAHNICPTILEKARHSQSGGACTSNLVVTGSRTLHTLHCTTGKPALGYSDGVVVASEAQVETVPVIVPVVVNVTQRERFCGDGTAYHKWNGGTGR